MARRLCVLFALPLVLALAARADNSRLATLEQKLTDAPDAERSALLVQISFEIETNDTDRAWDYAQKARQAARTRTDEIRADTRLAALLRRRGRYGEALALATSALSRARALGDDQLRAEALLVAGWTQGSLANFPAALEAFRELIPLAEARGDAAFLARSYNSLGIAYSDADQLDLSRQAYADALRHAERSTDRRMLASVLNNLGALAVQTKDLAAARRHHEQALALRLESGTDTRGVADSHQNLAELALLEARPVAAILQIEQAIALHSKLDLRRNLANARITFASALLQLGRPAEALTQLESARQLTESLDSATMRERVYNALAHYHEAQGDYRAALEWTRKADRAQGDAIGEKSRQRFDSLQALYDAERRQREIVTLRRDQTEKDAALALALWQRYALLAIIGFGFVAALAVASRIRTKRRADQRILAETRAAKETAEQADALKTRLIGMVSHDIRGPLHNVLHLVEEARDERDPHAASTQLDLIASETQRVAALAQDLLDTAALEAGRLELQRAPADLAEIVRATLGQLEPSAKAKDQTLAFAVGPRDEGILEADAARLAQVVSNLVSNAIKYSPRGARISLALERTPEVVRLFVRDRGPGIPAAELLHLFKPFAKLSARPTGGESSHGLGLSLAHDLVRLHGGSITVRCPSDGGSIFAVELPLSQSSTAG